MGLTISGTEKRKMQAEFSLYKCGISLKTDNPLFWDYVLMNLKHFSTEEVSEHNINVEILFNYSEAISFPEKRFAKGVCFSGNTLYVKHPLYNFLISFDAENNIKIYAGIRTGIKKKIVETLKSALIPNYSYKEHVYHHLLRELIVLPFFRTVRITKQRFLMHASAVTVNNKTFVFCGNDGVGKTTIALKLLETESSSYFGDNFLLYDNREIYSFCDTVRVNHREGKQIRQKYPFLKEAYSGKNRTYFNIIPEKIAHNREPDSFCLIRQGNELKKEEISSSAFVNMALQINDYVKEFDKYSYVALLDQIDILSQQDYFAGAEACRALTCNKKCYMLTLPEKYTTSQIINLLK